MDLLEAAWSMIQLCQSLRAHLLYIQSSTVHRWPRENVITYVRNCAKCNCVCESNELTPIDSIQNNNNKITQAWFLFFCFTRSAHCLFVFQQDHAFVFESIRARARRFCKNKGTLSAALTTHKDVGAAGDGLAGL